MKLEEMKVPELREKAHALGIEGADSLKKAELISAISKVEPQTVVGKIVNAVDKMIHPNKPAEPDQAPAAQPAQSSCAQSDLAKHPKFAKFKSQGEKQHD